MLVLNLGIDKGLTEGQIDNALWAQREDFLAYAISFAVIGRFWLVHHRFFAEVEAFDGRLLGLNLAYLAFVVGSGHGRTMKATDSPGLEQETDQPRSTTTA